MGILTITNKRGDNAYRIEPSSNGLCFELHKWDEGGKERVHNGQRTITEPRWVFTGKYPSTIARALELVGEDIERTYDWDTSGTVTSLVEAAAHFKSVIQGFVVKGELAAGEI